MFEQIGVVDVDSGLLAVGDPCYHVDTAVDEDHPILSRCWSKFCDWLYSGSEEPVASKQVNHTNGHAGMSVVFRTMYGDGRYPVYAEMVDGRPARVIIDMTGD